MGKGRHRNRGLMNRMALEVAGGKSISDWSKANDVPRRTCAEWARSAEFRELVERIRGRMLDRAAGQLSRDVTLAIREIKRLVTKGEPDSVRLAASRAVIATLIEIENHSASKRQLAELLARISALEGNHGTK